ncbi:MAG: substrate-binding domain-containing protein [Burkholderiales bacterium]
MQCRGARVLGSFREIHWWLAGLIATTTSLAVYAEPLVIPGTAGSEFVLNELAKAYEGGIVSIPPSIGSTRGIKAVRTGQAALGRVSRTLTDEERAVGLKYQAFARDAAVFVAGSGANVTSLTSAQVRDIFSGRIRRWAEVGGADVPIRVVTREPTAAVATALRNAFPEFADAKTFEEAKLAGRSAENLELLFRYRMAIGLSSWVEVREASHRLAVLTIDGKVATNEAVRSGRYPAAIEHAFVWKGRLEHTAERFIDFVYTPRGQAVLMRFGLIPMAPIPE